MPLQVDADGKLATTASFTASGSAIQDGVSSAILATVKDYTNSNPLAVVQVDTNGDPVGGGAGDASAANQALEIAELQELSAQKLDYDTGGGTATTVVMGMALPASGGPVAGGTATNPLRTDPTGTTAQPVTDNGGSLTIDGTITANAGTNLNTSALALEGGGNLAAAAASLSVLDDWDETDRAKVNLIVGQAGIAAGTGVDGVTVPRVTLATNVGLPAGTNNIGDVDVLSSALPTGAATETSVAAAATSLAIIDDWDETDRAKVNPIAGQAGVQGGAGASTALTQRVAIATDANAITAVGTVADDATTPGAPVMVGGQAVSPDGTDPTSVAEGDVARLRTDLNRRLLVSPTHPRTTTKHLDGTAAYTDEVIAAAPGAGLQTIITNIIGSTGAATALNFFLEEGAAKIFGPIYLEAVAGRGFASGPIYLPVTANTAVTLTSSAAIAQSYQIEYFTQAV